MHRAAVFVGVGVGFILWLSPLPLSAPPAFAQTRPDALAPARFDPAMLERDYRRARLQRNLGIVLAVPGVATTMAGLVLVTYGAAVDPNLFSGVVEIASGIIAAVVGLAVAIPGAILWERGQDGMDRVKWRRQQTAHVGWRMSGSRTGWLAGITVSY